MASDRIKVWKAVATMVASQEKLDTLEEEITELIDPDMTGENMTDEEGESLRTTLQHMQAARKVAMDAVQAALYDRSELEEQAATMLGKHHLLQEEKDLETQRQQES